MTKKHKKTTEEAVNENATLSRRAAFIGGVALLTGGAAGAHSVLSDDTDEEAARDAGEQAGREAAEEEIERSFQQITVSGLDYEMVETGLEYVEEELGSDYAEEIVPSRQFELWGESDDVEYLEGEITWRLNEDRFSRARHYQDRDEFDEPKWTGRSDVAFDVAKTFLEGIDTEYEDTALLEEYSDEEPNEADLDFLNNEDYASEEVLEQYGSW